jgi:DNA-binding MarR family transcriptional regulator
MPKRPRSNATVPASSGRRNGVDLGLLDGLIGYALRRAQVAVFQDFFRTFAALDIRPAQLGVLAVLERNPGLRQTEIAAALGIQRTNLVGLVDALEARGLIERRAGPQDRRSTAVHLTEAGKVLVRRLRRLVELHEARVTAGLDEAERKQLLALLQRLAERSP